MINFAVKHDRSRTYDVMDDTLGGATITPQPVGIAACGMVTVAAPSVSYGCTCCLELSIGDQV